MQYTPRRKLTREFKLEAVRQVALSEKPKAQLARELGVRVGQLRTWRLEFEKEAVTGIAKPDRSAAEDLEQLRRENAKLKMEIEILKKRPSTSLGKRSEVRLRREESTAVWRAGPCEALQVSRSGYYAARHRGPSARLQRQGDLTARIRSGRCSGRRAQRGCGANARWRRSAAQARWKHPRERRPDIGSTGAAIGPPIMPCGLSRWFVCGAILGRVRTLRAGLPRDCPRRRFNVASSVTLFASYIR